MDAGKQSVEVKIMATIQAEMHTSASEMDPVGRTTPFRQMQVSASQSRPALCPATVSLEVPLRRAPAQGLGSSALKQTPFL